MAKKTTFVAVAPDGTRFTRTSASRVYTHAILSRADFIAIQRVVDSPAVAERRRADHRHYSAILDGSSHHLRPVPWRDEAQQEVHVRTMQKRARAAIGDMDEDAYVVSLHAAATARIIAAEEVDAWKCEGWAGSYNLAGRRAASVRNQWNVRDAIIVPATTL